MIVTKGLTTALIRSVLLGSNKLIKMLKGAALNTVGLTH